MAGQFRSALTVVASIASVLAGAACGHAASPAVTGPSSSAGQMDFPAHLDPGGVVPWVDAPAVSADFEPASPAVPPAAGPACSTAQLSAVLPRWIRKITPGEPEDPLLSGSLYGYVVITNVSLRPCTLQGTPSVQILTRAPESVPIVSADLGGSDSPPVGLPPGDQVNFRLDWEAPYCGHGAPFSMLATLRAITLSVTLKDQAAPRCVHEETHPEVLGGLAASAVTPGNAQPVSLLRSPLRYLKAAALEVPASVHPGQVIRFIIALTNPTSSAISLAGRLGYSLEVFCLGTQGRAGMNYSLAYLLNNRPISLIAPQSTVRFAMVLRLGRQPFPGPALDVTWKSFAASNVGGPQPWAFFQARTAPSSPLSGHAR